MIVFRHERPALFQRWIGHHERTEWHDHDHDQLIHPSRGALVVATQAGTWLVPPHRAVWLPAGQPHAHQAHGATHLRSVLFEPGTGTPDHAGRAPHVVGVSPLLRELLRTLTDTPPPHAAKETLLRSLVIEELVFDAVPPPPHLVEPTDPRLRAIAAMLHSDPADPRSLPELGRAVGASDRTLSRLCATDLGMTFPVWRAQIRLLHAALALTDGESVTTVPYRHGYSSPSAFVAAFRRTFDITPSAYQKKSNGTPAGRSRAAQGRGAGLTSSALKDLAWPAESPTEPPSPPTPPRSRT